VKKEEEAPQQSQQVNEEETKFESELKLLSDMGFIDREKNLVLLVAMNGDLPEVLLHLF